MECFFARPIDDEDEHSRNDGWECLISKTLNKTKLNSNKEALKILFVHLLS